MTITHSTFKTHILIFLLIFSFTLSAQVGIGTNTPNRALDVEVNAAAEGIQINNIRGNGDPTLQYQVNGTTRITMGIDDSDADKFKIGTTAITTNTRLTIETGGDIGIRTTTPTNMFQMTNGGVAVGANAMAAFDNSGTTGVSLSGYNSSTTNPYNGVLNTNGNDNSSSLEDRVKIANGLAPGLEIHRWRCQNGNWMKSASDLFFLEEKN